MRAPRVFAYAFLAASLLLAPAARAAVDAFIWFENSEIRGGSRDPKHMGWIEVESPQLDQFRSAATIGSATSGAGAGKVRFNEFTITKRSDSASPMLAQAFDSKRRFPKVMLSVRKAGGGQQEFLTFELENVMISSFRAGGAGGGGDLPTESLALNFGAVKFVYVQQATPTPGLKGAPRAAVAPAALQGVPPPRHITGVTASAPFLGTSVTVTITSTGPCTNAFVGYGDGSINEGHALTGTSTQIPAHVYATPGVKKIQVGSRDAPFWTGPTKPRQKDQVNPNDCTGWAETTVTLRSDAAPAPLNRKVGNVP